MKLLHGAFIAIALAGAPAFADGCSSSASNDIVDTAVAAGSFKTLVAAVKHAGLADALKGDGPFTVFAPTDAAFAKLPEGTLEHLLKPENRETLKAILTYHVVSGKVDAATASKLTFAETLNGQRISIDAKHGVQIDGAKVVKADIDCSNGVIHVIDTVILPKTDSIVTTAVKAKSFKTLAAALEAANLIGALQGPGPFTVFAPTDAAFAKLPKGTVETLLKPENKAKLVQILKLHVVSGRVYSDQALSAGAAKTLEGSSVKIGVKDGVARVSGSKLVTLDIQAANGVIHVIDEVILPGSTEVSSSCPARSLIKLARARGDRFEQAGNMAASAAVYEVALQSLIELGGDKLPMNVRQRLQSSLDCETGCSSSRATALRKALDQTAAALNAAARRGKSHISHTASERTFF